MLYSGLSHGWRVLLSAVGVAPKAENSATGQHCPDELLPVSQTSPLWTSLAPSSTAWGHFDSEQAGQLNASSPMRLICSSSRPKSRPNQKGRICWRQPRHRLIESYRVAPPRRSRTESPPGLVLDRRLIGRLNSISEKVFGNWCLDGDAVGPRQVVTPACRGDTDPWRSPE